MNEAEQHEIDDELLSAYLDDELSPDERARVEDRLAADPAARHTLEQLRNISQSMRDLPNERLGRDLRHSILQRSTASRTVLGPDWQAQHDRRVPQPQPAPTLPTVSIGRTTRGWFWAAAAIAAAVLIMVFQPKDDHRADLPDIARKAEPRTQASAPSNRSIAEAGTSDGALESDGIPATAAPARTTPAAPSSDSQSSFVDNSDGMPTAPSSEPTMTSGQLEPGIAALPFRGEARRDMPLAASPPADQPTVETAAAAIRPVVVRVLARRAAVENSAFETLLQKNGVVVGPTTQALATKGAAAVSRPAPAASASAESLADARSNEESKSEDEKILQRLKKAPDDDDVEFVLVDAPSSTILSCMNELSADADNYVGISVDDATATDKARAAAEADENKQAFGLARFNRGPVPPSDEPLAEVAHYFDYLGGDSARRESQQESFAKPVVSGGAKDSELKELEQRAFGEGSGIDRGRGLRLPLRAIGKTENPGSSELDGYAAQSTSDAQRSSGPLAAPAVPDNGRMQVLFVIRPTDEPAPSLKAKNRPE